MHFVPIQLPHSPPNAAFMAFYAMLPPFFVTDKIATASRGCLIITHNRVTVVESYLHR